jgi:hypothetical protein
MSTTAIGTPSITLATFADPSPDSSDYLFKVDFTQMLLSGGWSDAQTGLVLEIPCSGYTVETSNAFQDVWFEMSTVNIINASVMSGQTGAGVINFYENGTSTDPLVIINFTRGEVSRYGFGADGVFVADNVTITGSKIPGNLLEEHFSFGFANLARLPGHGHWSDGFIATTAFTSSAIVNPDIIPEPATICILSMGAFSLIKRKK